MTDPDKIIINIIIITIITTVTPQHHLKHSRLTSWL